VREAASFRASISIMAICPLDSRFQKYSTQKLTICQGDALFNLPVEPVS
jgi:hypothetical protein